MTPGQSISNPADLVRLSGMGQKKKKGRYITSGFKPRWLGEWCVPENELVRQAVFRSIWRGGGEKENEIKGNSKDSDLGNCVIESYI